MRNLMRHLFIPPSYYLFSLLRINVLENSVEKVINFLAPDANVYLAETEFLLQ